MIIFRLPDRAPKVNSVSMLVRYKTEVSEETEEQRQYIDIV